MIFSTVSPSSNLYYFAPQAQARQNAARNKPGPEKLSTSSNRKGNRKTQKLKSRKFPPPQPLKQLSAIPGGDATTYTRLPPKDDFFEDDYDPDGLTDSESSKIVKLSESAHTVEQTLSAEIGKSLNYVGRNVKNGGKRGSDYSKFKLYDAKDQNLIEEIEAGLDFDGEDVKDEGELEFDYGKFELYEVDDSDLDTENEDDFDETKAKGEIFGFGDEDDEEIKEKEKGVPAVMRCFDRAKIFVKAGDGGNGVVAFRREKFVPLGGPSGGDGGRGGNVYVEVDGSMNSLLPFRQSVHFRAGRGAHGQGSKQNGARGEDVVVKVPPGTVIREAIGKGGVEGDVLLELLHPGQKALLLPGGKGGRGNASFKSGMNKVPKIAENGEEGLEMWLELELKLVADVGIVGAPNAGKSTFLSVVSAAQPAIANYPFTTLLPNLGVVSFDYDATMVVADLPGLLEGAHRGFGLGHEFLRHTERCTVLIHVVDGSSQQPEYEFEAVRLELEMFSPELADKPFLVVYNKMDLPDAYENWESFREKLRSRGLEPFCMSAVKSEGTHDVICAAYELVRKKREAYNEGEGTFDPVDLNYVAKMVQKQRTAPINEFEISHDKSSNTWHVDGAGLDRFAQMTNWRYVDSERRFQHVLEACGVYKSLMKLGVKEGDTVIVGEMEMVWHDSSDNAGPARLRKWAEQSIKGLQ